MSGAAGLWPVSLSLGRRQVTAWPPPAATWAAMTAVERRPAERARVLLDVMTDVLDAGDLAVVRADVAAGVVGADQVLRFLHAAAQAWHVQATGEPLARPRRLWWFARRYR